MTALAKGFASIVLMSVAAGCSSSPAKGIDAAGTQDVGQTSDVSQAYDVSPAYDVPPEVPASATLDPPAEISFPEAPEIACNGNASACTFPPSACGDPNCDGGGACTYWDWVVYYDSPTCVNSRCVYVKKYFRCDSSSICTTGGCRFNGTA